MVIYYGRLLKSHLNTSKLITIVWILIIWDNQLVSFTGQSWYSITHRNVLVAWLNLQRMVQLVVGPILWRHSGSVKQIDFWCMPAFMLLLHRFDTYSLYLSHENDFDRKN